LSDREVASASARWGWKIFGLAFLFRLQSWLISGGAFPRTLLKVDILNVMGLGMLAAAGLWALGRTRAQRVAWLGGAAVAAALAAPVLRSAAWVTQVPRPFSWYLVPVAGWTTFSLTPWVAFLFAGAALGLCLDAATDPHTEHRLMRRLAVAGPGMALVSFVGSWLPSWYASSSFWTTSPSFFFLRLGLLLAALPLARAWAARWPGWDALRQLGAASFFVYWVHVELVYGVLTLPIHKALPFGWALAGYVAFVLAMIRLVRVWERVSWPPAFLRQPPAEASGPAGAIL
jgi:hypothetical protein